MRSSPDDPAFVFEYLADHMLRTSRVLQDASGILRADPDLPAHEIPCDLNAQMRYVAAVIRPVLETTSEPALFACGELWARAANAIVEELSPGLIDQELEFRRQREQRELEWALTHGREATGLDPQA